MAFIKRVEDFSCAHCGAFVQGTGYTNHCPKCLWSQHVDVDPGDRLATCHGMMEPVGVEIKGDAVSVWQQCVTCGFRRKNVVSPEDEMKVVIEISKRPPPGYFTV